MQWVYKDRSAQVSNGIYNFRYRLSRVYGFGTLFFVCVIALAAQQPACPAITDEHMAVEGNALIVTLTLKRVDGTSRPACFVFDSGGDAIILDQSLADDLGLKPAVAPMTDGAVRFS